MKIAFLASALSLAPAQAQTAPAGQEAVPLPPYHLTARPWAPLGTPRDAYLDVVEGLCRYARTLQDQNGAIVDPFLKREHQYGTPYYALAVGALAEAGRAGDLLESGARAMDHATECFGKGIAAIPDAHGEFFAAALPAAFPLYRGRVSEERMRLWAERLKVPREEVIRGPINNWLAYAMLGEWLRTGLGLADRRKTEAFIADSWEHATQRERIAGDRWNLYQDRGTDPESHAVEAVGRVNLLALVAEGYDGKDAGEIAACAARGTAATLLLQDPSGQCPPDGRASDHVWNDVLYQLGFELMAERTARSGEAFLAGQYRRAALLSFGSFARWRRTDGPWAGSYFVTKNRFPPEDRVGYQAASNYANYNGAVMLHLAEAWLARRTDIAEQPAPVEIGGYAFATDPKFASAFANAGGMQLAAALRGDTEKVYGRYWTALGVTRLGRVNWETRLGPSDGVRDAATGNGITFAPTWKEGGRWVRLADVPERYEGKFSAQFVHPLLVRCAIDYVPRDAKDGGPSFRHAFTITPDGVLATLHRKGTAPFGTTWPLLENDGKPLRTEIAAATATTAYAADADQQCFLSLDPDGKVAATGTRLQSTYGWLRDVRAEAAGSDASRTFVYPRNPCDPTAEAMRQSLRPTPDGFDSMIGSVHGTLYVGRTSAGGEGREIDCDGDGRPDAVFDTPCRFVLQLRQGKITAVEADRDVSVRIGGRRIALKTYTPVNLP